MSGILTTGTVQGLRTLSDKTLRITLDLQEMPSDKAGQLIELHQRFIKLYISSENIDSKTMEIISELDIADEVKSPSQRLRNVLYRLWEQDAEDYEDFNLYYRYKVELLITKIKDRLT